MSRARGQAGLEFLILSFMLLVIFAAVLFSYDYNTSRYFNRNTELQMRNVERSVSYAIAAAVIEGDGFSTKISLPQQIFGRNYTANISGSYLYLTLENSEFAHSAVLLSPNVTGAIAPGELTVSNKGGKVTIG